MMSVTDLPGGPGHDDGPISFEHYKRAVLRAPPSQFSIEFLPPTKQGGSYSYGMRIWPAIDDNYSISSSGTNSDYEIWRRWEDCLWFQENLELEYKRAARERKIRLKQGKGVKNFNGLYKQDAASSWESLPPGPDPNSVAQNVHDLVPRLTKKGTVFRASQSTIDQRHAEMKALVEALFRDDMPALIQEIRSARLVTDFFGYWRRDNDLAEKTRKSVTPRGSVTSSIFSSYFSASNTSLSETKSSRSMSTSPEKRSPSTLRVPPFSQRPHSMASSDITEESRYPASTRRSSVDNDRSIISRRRRALSTTSSDSSSTHSDGSSESSATSSRPSIAEDFPIVFGHNPQHRSDPNDRPVSALEVLPEEDIFAKQEGYKSTSIRRSATSDRSSRVNRGCHIFVSPASTTGSQGQEVIITRPDRSVRDSWQTTMSTETILDGLGLSLPASERCNRESMASIATFMTTDSANAILPPPPPTSTATHSSSGRPRISIPVTLSDYDMWSDIDEAESSILDEFPRPASFIPAQPDSRPETPLGHFFQSSTPGPLSSCFSSVPASPTTTISTFVPASPTASTISTFVPASPTASTISTFVPASPTTSAISFSAPASPTASTFSTSALSETSNSSACGSLSIKASHNNAIIMLRTTRNISLSDVRQRLYNKFVGQEGIPLSLSFTIAFVLPTLPNPLSKPPQGRNCSIPVTSIAERIEKKFINSQAEWEQVISYVDSNKITLRILDSN